MDEPIETCDAAVGAGKTTAVMAYLLRLAEKKDLRHIFVVVPFTNIIQQSAETYREALTLEGENAAEVVAEVHHRAEFENPDLREMSVLWDAPVTITTAVQFFETMAASHPARLRKLHELAGSAVLLDEAHAAMTSKALAADVVVDQRAWRAIGAAGLFWPSGIAGEGSGKMPDSIGEPEKIPGSVDC